MPDDTPPIAGVRFNNAGKIFYFHTAGMRLEPGEYVIVETVRGPEIAKVIIAPGQVVVNELGRDDLKPILRLATDSDIRRADSLRTRANELVEEARRLAADARFPARIDRADFTLDGRRLTFSFTSEDRLDYREFLRRVGDRFGAKVDMRQLGPRDRAKSAGGYGICGRELCCSNWLTSFPAISIRMAKEQDLPLNPQKISGLCGRLLCCLSYEDDGYREMRRSLPKLGQRCSTPTGEGKVIGLNILRRQVTLVVDGQRLEVRDRDLGTVVRWDTASKIGTPPPSLTRAEAIAQGLIEDTGEEEEFEPAAAEVDWITGELRPTATPGAGRGRLPGGGPRRTMPPRRPPPEAGPGQPPPQRGGPPPSDRGRTDRRPPGRPAGPTATGPGSPSRPFQRSDGAPPPPRAAGGAETPATPPGEEGARRRRRRGRGGRGQNPGNDAPATE
ncbi:MAG: stage 0 sporulation family protein [Dehalococcoidia bacterium]